MRTSSIGRAARRVGSRLLPLLFAGPLLAQPTLAGRVLGPDDEPLEGVRVELAPVPSSYEAGRLRLQGAGLPFATAVAESDREGRFLLRAPHPGVWRIVARASGRVPMQRGPLLLLEAEEIPTVRLQTDVGTHLQVLDPKGRPVPGVWIVASSEENTDIGSHSTRGWQPEFRVGLTADDGSLTLPRLADERLRVSVHVAGRLEEGRAGFRQGIIRLAADSEESLTLRVVTPGGEPAPGVLVRAGPSLWPVGLTDPKGELRIPARRGEPASILLMTPDGRQQILRADGRSQGAAETVILRPGMRFRGRVLDAQSREGLTGAWIWLTADPATVVRTDREGTYFLTASARQRLSLVVKATGYLPKRLAVQSSEAGKDRGPTLALERAAAVGGSVVGPDGGPLSGATVEAVHASNLSPRTFSSLDPISDRAATASDGRFELRQLRPRQDYELRVTRRGYFPAAAAVVAPAAGSSSPPVQMRLRPVCGVHGAIEDPQARPLDGATISLTPARRLGTMRDLPPVPELDSAATVVKSGLEGRFAIQEPPADEVDLEVRKKGFAPALRRSLRIGAPCRGSFDLGTLVLQPGAQLAGRIVDRRGQALFGAKVFRVDRVPPRTRWLETLRDRVPEASTDGEGHFTLEDLPLGTAQNLLVQAPGHLVAAARGVRPPLDDPLLIRMETAALLRGRVVDSSDAAVSGAQVLLEWQRMIPGDPRRLPVGEPIYRSAVSDEEGRFEIRDVPEGDVSLHVTAQGFVPLEGEPTRLPQPEPDRKLVLVLLPGASLEGRVVTDAGEPVPGVRLHAGGHKALSDAEGVYSLNGLALGDQELLVSHLHHGRFHRPVWIDEGVNHLDVELESGFEVAGHVVDEAGSPLNAAAVALTPEGRSALRIHEARTGENGRFSLKPVRAGRYRLEARAVGFAPGELPHPLVVSDQPVDELEIVLRPGATVGGWVLGLSSEELAAVEVTAHAPADETRLGRVDSEGRFEIRDLPPGDWLLRASVWDGQRQVEARVPIAPSDRWLRQNLEFGRRANLSGRVVLGEEPLAASHVSVRGERFSTERTVVTGFDGGFLFQDLEPDLYWLGVKDSNRLLVHNQTLELAHDLDIEVRLETASIAGSVKDEESGAPIPDALLSLRPADGPQFLITDSTLPNGSFRLFNVPPGTYRLTATARNHAPAERPLSLVPGQELQDLELVLEATSGIELQIRLASGETPSLFHVLARDEAGAPGLAGSFTPGPAGSTELTSLPAGDWQLTVGASGGATVTRWVTVPGEPVPITLPPAASLQIQVPALARENLLATVRLLGPDQQPFWRLGPGGQIEQTWTLRGGKGLIEAVPAGVWSVIAEAADGRSWVGSAATAGSAASSISLE